MDIHKNNFIQNIFSISNTNKHKVITILGIKFKIKRIKTFSNYDKLKNLCEIADLDILLNKGLRCDHPVGIVIAYKEFGYNNVIYQNVTIGAKNGFKSNFPEGYPILKNNIIVYAGAVICGDITIGNNVEIGANSLVIKDVPDNCIVAGNPARIIGVKNDT